MFLSESYKFRMQALAGIITESKKSIEYEFQLRDIGGPVFYMREKGEETWKFISAEKFAENCHKGKLVKWDKK